MLDTAELKQAFSEKLAHTGNLDEAFTKAVWLAYKQGMKDAPESSNQRKE